MQNCLFRRSMRLRNGRGPPHWRHGLRALVCAGWYKLGTGQLRPRVLACGLGRLHQWHGQCALACGAILTNGTGPARMGQQWRALGVRCNGWIKCLRAPQARGVARLRPGKPLVLNKPKLLLNFMFISPNYTVSRNYGHNYGTSWYFRNGKHIVWQ